MKPAYLGAVDIPKNITNAAEMLDWLLQAMSENAKETGCVLASQGEVNSWQQAWLRVKDKEEDTHDSDF